MNPNPPGHDVPSRASDAGPEWEPEPKPTRQQAVSYLEDEAEDELIEFRRAWRARGETPRGALKSSYAEVACIRLESAIAKLTEALELVKEA